MSSMGKVIFFPANGFVDQSTLQTRKFFGEETATPLFQEYFRDQEGIHEVREEIDSLTLEREDYESLVREIRIRVKGNDEKWTCDETPCDGCSLRNFSKTQCSRVCPDLKDYQKRMAKTIGVIRDPKNGGCRSKTGPACP